MIQIRCQRCGWVFTLNRDAIGLAVAEAEAARADYYQEPCPKCRNAVKIQVKELRRRLPPDYVLPALPPKPEPVHVKKEEEPKAEPKTAPKAEATAAEAPKRPSDDGAAKPAVPPKPSKPAVEPAAKPKPKARPAAGREQKSGDTPKPKVSSKQKSKS